MEIMIEYISERGRMAQGTETEFQRLKRAASESRKTTTKSPNKCKKKKKRKERCHYSCQQQTKHEFMST